MTVKISFLGEGPEDYGTLEGKVQADHVRGKYKGHIQMFVERILQQCCQGQVAHFQPYPLDPRELHQHTHVRKERHEKLEPLATRTKLAIQKACICGHSALVVLMDDRHEDNKPILEKLQKGRAEAELDGNYLPTALGTAIKEIEAWILADDHARPFGLGEQCGRYPLPDLPEQIADPKSKFLEWQGQHCAALKRQGQQDAPDEMACKEAIINQIDIAQLTKLCPQGFKPFLAEIKQHILPLFAKK
jgi:hypothetical protein